MASKLSSAHPFDSISFTKREMFRLKIADEMELSKWVSILHDDKFVDSDDFKASKKMIELGSKTILGMDFKLAPLGWNKVESLYSNVNSKKVFIAIQFSNPERAQIQKAIEEACRDAGGWEAFTIDKKEYSGSVTDEIIASINQARFVIAEFTGNNQGVYYEAGYAVGAKIPVIYLVKKSQLDAGGAGLHFDTRHINHIAWETFDDLKQKVKNRVQAVIRT
jgi:nucleoside 2-deoxyribosyltransferase